MTYINKYCVDAGTPNCPCPLAETGDCLVCSRLAGKETCNCTWAGLCIYNEYIQNGSVVRNRRKDQTVKISRKAWYDDDLLTMTLEIDRGMALVAARPGSFVFLKPEGKDDFFSVPVSVMAADMQKGQLHLALKVISAKTKMIDRAEGSLTLRGVYRNGLLGEGLADIDNDIKSTEKQQPEKLHNDRRKWLILTKGLGLAPAVNLLRWVDGHVDVEMVIDTEKISRNMIDDCFYEYVDRTNLPAKISMESLQRIVEDKSCRYDGNHYDRIFILASDYYIKRISEILNIPPRKLIFSNNFHMCCGEGICGACGYTDADGNFSKMCKCRSCGVKELMQ